MLTRRSPLLALAVLGGLALVLRALDLDRPPSTDELYHLLPARAWLAEGRLRIADGVYERAALFTIFLAHWLALLGDDIVVARLPSVIAGTALVALVFLWTRNVAGTLAAVLAAAFLALDPESIEIGRFARFYALHGLLFWLGATSVYRLTTAPPPPGRALLLAAGSMVCFAAAFYLQITTLVGLVGVVAWAAATLALRWLPRLPPRVLLSTVVGAAAFGALAVWLAIDLGLVAKALLYYRWTPPHRPGIVGTPWYYHYVLTLSYPTFWPLVALAVAIGLAWRPRPTAFCASIAGSALLLHSFAGIKAMRYVYYALPFLFVLWGIALAAVWPRLRRFLEEVARRMLSRLHLERLHGPGVRALLVIVLVFALAANSAFVRTAAITLGMSLRQDEPTGDWAAAKATLEPWLASAALLVTTSELETLYHLGRYDVLISNRRDSEFERPREFAIDPRTSRPVITKPASLALLMDCYPDGLIVSSDDRWRNPAHLDDAVANLIVRRAEELALPAAGMRAYAWHRADAARRSEACERLRREWPAAPSAAARGSAPERAPGA